MTTFILWAVLAPLALIGLCQVIAALLYGGYCLKVRAILRAETRGEPRVLAAEALRRIDMNAIVDGSYNTGQTAGQAATRVMGAIFRQAQLIVHEQEALRRQARGDPAP